MTNDARIIKIQTGSQRIVSMEELYQGYEETHRLQSQLLFEEKIVALVEMQKMAFSWGGRQDVIVWKI